jgi:hypothetical protein
LSLPLEKKIKIFIFKILRKKEMKAEKENNETLSKIPMSVDTNLEALTDLNACRVYLKYLKVLEAANYDVAELLEQTHKMIALYEKEEKKKGE